MPTSLLVAFLALAQAGVSTPATPSAISDNPAVLACTPGHLSLTGIVKDSTGTPVPGAVVSVVNLDTGRRLVVGTGHRREPSTGADIGRYCSGEITPGRYSLSIEKSGFIRQVEGEVDLRKAAAEPRLLDFVVYPELGPTRGTALLVLIAGLFLYLTTVWLVRWYNVAWFARGPLNARLSSLDERVRHEPDPTFRREIDALTSSVAAGLKRQEGGGKFADFLFWSRGQEQETWMQIHDVEQRLVELLPDNPVERLVARLRVVEEELRVVGTPEALVLANTAHTVLAAPSMNPKELRALISQGLQLTYDTRDETYWNLATRQNKSTWLLLASAGMIVAVVAVADRLPLMVAGAAGGLLSRLLRAQRAEETPSDYGASWSTLFFSPLLGALTGWFGVLILVALNSLNLLGSVFQGIDWERPMAPMALAAACLFGVSERLFDGLIAAVEQRTEVRRRETVTGAAGGDKPAKPDVNVVVAQSDAIHIDRLTRNTAHPGEDVGLQGIVITRHNTKPLSVDAVKKLTLVADGKQGVEVTPRAGNPGEIVLKTPDNLSAGVYHFKITASGGAEWEQDDPRLTVEAKVKTATD